MFLSAEDIIIVLFINIFFILSTGFYGARKFLKYDHGNVEMGKIILNSKNLLNLIKMGISV